MSSEKSSEAREKREAVTYLLEVYRIGLHRSCRLMMQSRMMYHYRSCRNDRAATLRIRENAETRIRYSVQRIHILLRRE
ncbi:putative transposase [Lonsdalea quercina]|uniref:Putative transposase n=1 Tax=Lonsdalea quercina TaxID=71657 RepID=A0A1H3ZGT4_9GAMM|nr:putative transposase [Lonsdalea quercina]